MHIRIEFEATDPPQGLIVRGDGGQQLTFAGWLGLVTTLERVLEPALIADGGRADVESGG